MATGPIDYGFWGDIGSFFNILDHVEKSEKIEVNLSGSFIDHSNRLEKTNSVVKVKIETA